MPLEPGDVIDRPLPKRSVVKVGKLFTMHRRLVTSTFGSVEDHKLSEILGRLRVLFTDKTRRPQRVEVEAVEGKLRMEEVDETVLPLLHMNAFEEKSAWRAWKNLDRDAMDRLHDKDLIGDPRSRARSVMLIDEGRRLAEEALLSRGQFLKLCVASVVGPSLLGLAGCGGSQDGGGGGGGNGKKDNKDGGGGGGGY